MTLGNLGLALLVVAIVGAGGTWLASYLTRDLKILDAAAKGVVRARLQRREPRPLSSFVQGAAVPEELAARAESLLQRVAAVLEVPATSLRPEDRLGDLLRVRPEELGPDSRARWQRARLASHLEVFSHDLWHMLGAVTDKTKWEHRYQQLAQRPMSDDEWLNLLMAWELGEFVVFFAPLLRDDLACPGSH